MSFLFRSVVKEINGTMVGIIGFITQATSYNFPNNTITFTDEIANIKVVGIYSAHFTPGGGGVLKLKNREEMN